MSFYHTSKPPAIVKHYFELNYRGCEFAFYWYWSSKCDNKKKIWGCNVKKDGVFYHNATQATVEDYKMMSEIPL